jgi:hypothetical protein
MLSEHGEDTVMHMIGREPVYALDLDVEAANEARPDIFEGEIAARLDVTLYFRISGAS